MPYFEPSRPMLLSFIPPNAAIISEITPWLMPTMPYPSPSAARVRGFDRNEVCDVRRTTLGGDRPLIAQPE